MIKAKQRDSVKQGRPSFLTKHEERQNFTTQQNVFPGAKISLRGVNTLLPPSLAVKAIRQQIKI